MHDAVLDGVLDVDEPDHAQGGGEGLGVAAHLLDLAVPDEVRGQDAGRVAGMDARVFDVLHHPPDHAAPAVGDGVHIPLEGVFQEAVDEHGMLGRHAGRLRKVLAQGAFVVDDLHGSAAEHVRRAHQHGIADAGRHGHRFLHRSRDAVGGLRDAEPTGERLEALPVFGDVDRVGRRAEDGHARRLQRFREPEWRLAAELHHDALGALPAHDLDHILEGERLEVQLVRDVEVGGDGLRVGVDHDRLVA